MHNMIGVFVQCSMFEFKHLPMPGGLYDQNPEFLAKMQYILMQQEIQRKKDEKAKDRKKMGPTPKNA